MMSADELGGKTVGFLCAAGGPRGYMGVLAFANALMLDFRCWIVPRFVYATREEVVEGEVVSEDLRLRIAQLASSQRDAGAPAEGTVTRRGFGCSAQEIDISGRERTEEVCSVPAS